MSGDRPEVWLPIPDYEGLYDVSNWGRVRRSPSSPARPPGIPGNILQPGVTRGYEAVCLCDNGVVKNHRVHLLVLRSFCGEPPFEGAHAAHNDGNSQNNRLSNLRWATPKENQADVKRHGRRCQGTAVYGAILNDDRVREIRKRIITGERNPTIASDYGVSSSTIHLIRHNRIWKHVA